MDSNTDSSTDSSTDRMDSEHPVVVQSGPVAVPSGPRVARARRSGPVAVRRSQRVMDRREREREEVRERNQSERERVIESDESVGTTLPATEISRQLVLSDLVNSVANVIVVSTNIYQQAEELIEEFKTDLTDEVMRKIMERDLYYYYE
jgi:hypothetical protein